MLVMLTLLLQRDYLGQARRLLGEKIGEQSVVTLDHYV